ncbi:MAG TPA: efflux RND transporter periplasmic adaptor subunit [Steroidobacteraceae bacterium]|jgi:RND family efflux transporter MFP subunit|nr:efflux RND transporter periplasmic adaptor subunit [Steroidobacteraceae bacterium]
MNDREGAHRESRGPEHEEIDPREKEKLKGTAKKVVVVLVVLALVMAVWGIASRLIDRAHLRKQTAQDVQVTVVTVKATSSSADNELVLPANVTAFMEAPIYARTNGYLKTWNTDIGTRVHKGDLLAEIETPEVDRQLAQARADLDTAGANARLAQTTNARWQQLAAKQAVSKQDAEEKAGAAAATGAAETSARQNVKRLEDLESFKRVVAPFDGVITARNTDVGALINAGEASGGELFRLADIHVLRVYAQVPEAYAAETRAGLHAELRFMEHPGDAYPAETIRTSNALDPASRSMQVELQLDNKEGRFFPGAYAEVHFKLPSDHETLRLPSNTILFRDTGLQVATVGADHKVKLKTIVQGRDFGKTVEILGGLDPNDEVVVNPPDSIEDGLEVRVAPPPKKGDGSGAGEQGQAAGAQGQSGAQKGASEPGESKTKTKESTL